LRQFHVHLISDSTGETVSIVARAAIAHFEAVEAVEHVWSLVRSRRQIDKVLTGVEAHPGVVMFTLVDDELRSLLQERCRAIQVPCIPILDHVVGALSGYLGTESHAQPGKQHALDDEYFSRIEAMQFVLSHDDGQAVDDLEGADIVLVGVSRTSKTPTSIYLANRGVKTANVPVVPKVPLPASLFSLKRPLVVGLTTNVERLVQIRQNRLRMLHETGQTDYVDPEAVQEEITEARRIFAANGWSVIDVTRRSIEETAAAVLELYRRRSAPE
jgi:regulator of PEP synthase PpsR (kinase-PPPase family)|tara:strand:+ start:1669 stop:2484 length:816 start_codon:yes stop_codon:yes gene_type:complete